MIIKRVVAGIYGANCYIIMDEESKKAFVLDPGGDADDIEKAIKSMGANVEYILLTHGHTDHTGGVDDLHHMVGGKIGISEKDYILMKKGTYVYGGEFKDGVDLYLKNKDKISLGNLELECIETPGHTPGGLSFKIGNNVFTGDTLFAGSIGRSDLQGGNYEVLMNSINKNLLNLDDNIVVYPGHGPSTTLAKEKLVNPFIKG